MHKKFTFQNENRTGRFIIEDVNGRYDFSIEGGDTVSFNLKELNEIHDWIGSIINNGVWHD